jgi:serine/threonine-protein kinase RsbW
LRRAPEILLGNPVDRRCSSMAEIPNLRLRLPNRPENVLVVRQALSGVADCLALNAIDTNDLNTAVTEACNNVVVHAYEGGEGVLEVDVCARTDGLAVIVRDHGIGMPADDDREHARDAGYGGLGLAVIDSLSRHVEFAEPAGGGTEVRMLFAASWKAASLTVEAGERELLRASRRAPQSNVELKVAPSAMARAVLPRVLSVLAARAYFSTDRISDVQLVADVLAAKAGDSISGSYLDVGVSIAPRNLELRIGPLQTGRGESLLAAAADGLAPVIERLTDERHRVARADDSAEMLELRLVDQQR